LALFQDCCSHVHSFIEDLENFYGHDDFMDGEIMEALYENPFQQHKENLEDTHQDAQENLQQDQDCSMVEDERILLLNSQQELYEMDQQYEENLYTPPLEINEDNHCLSKREQKLLSPLFEDEIDQLLHDHVTVQVGIDLQYAHGQEGDGGTYSFAEKDDSLENSFIH